MTLYLQRPLLRWHFCIIIIIIIIPHLSGPDWGFSDTISLAVVHSPSDDSGSGSSSRLSRVSSSSACLLRSSGVNDVPVETHRLVENPVFGSWSFYDTLTPDCMGKSSFVYQDRYVLIEMFDYIITQTSNQIYIKNKPFTSLDFVLRSVGFALFLSVFKTSKHHKLRYQIVLCNFPRRQIDQQDFSRIRVIFFFTFCCLFAQR